MIEVLLEVAAEDSPGRVPAESGSLELIEYLLDHQFAIASHKCVGLGSD